MTTSNPFTSGHILLVIASLGGGGAERVVIDLCCYLIAHGRNVTVLTLSGDDPDAYQLPAGVHRERMEIRRAALSPLQSARFIMDHLRRMRRRIRDIDPDVVVSFVDQTNVRVLISTMLSGRPVVVAERTSPENHHLPRVWATGRRMSYGLADTVVVQTDTVAAWFRDHVPTKRLVVIPNAVRTRLVSRQADVQAAEPNGKFVLGVGRLGPEKGFDRLIDAFAASGMAAVGWKLILLGEGTQREALDQRAASLGLRDHIVVPGHVRNVAEWMSGAGMFVLSSRYEGFSNVLLEAMQIGVPCISFNGLGGARELIDHERNGLLVPQDDTDALSSAMRRFAADADLRARLGEAAKSVSARFSPERIYGLWLETIDTAARRRRPSTKKRGHA